MLNKEIRAFRWVSFLAVLILMLILTTASFVLAFSNYKPIKELARKVRKNEDEKKTIFNEFDEVEKSMMDAKSHIKTLNHMLNSEALGKIISGTISSEVFMDTLELNGIWHMKVMCFKFLKSLKRDEYEEYCYMIEDLADNRNRIITHISSYNLIYIY